MTYQVLARKWRPRSFADLVGQEHVVQALVNGLNRGQLHHAYLFTGTRGVGKTTLARILAKTLNCEEGIGPTPCGVCSTCREIDEGRYVDLLEVDAASRTKVDQTRELLDNVPFAPVRGRFKVYLIDEVHMFSASSFNALLKTLEEPPAHVKFVLATTDPQRLPATVLSRCLQFNLKRLLPAQIKGQFETVLKAEGIGFEEAGLVLLAGAADGSMRDGLSLLDQAIAFGGGRVTDADVRLMLGTRSDDLALDLITALAAGDGPRLLQEIARLAEITPDFAGVLADLLTALHRITLVQQVPALATGLELGPEQARIGALAADIPAEDVQLFYQILLLGQGDLPLAPDPRAGLEMVLLRALAFRPESAPVASPSRSGSPTGAAGNDATTPGLAGSGIAGPGVAGSGAVQAVATRTAPPPARPGTVRSDTTDQCGSVAVGVAEPLAGARSTGATLKPTASVAAPAGHASPLAPPAVAAPAPPTPMPSSAPASVPVSAPVTAPAAAPGAGPPLSGASPTARLADAADWRRFSDGAGLTGFAAELARNCAFVGWDGRRLRLALDPTLGQLRAGAAEQRLAAALAATFGDDIRLDIALAPDPVALDSTPAAQQAREAADRQAAAVLTMAQDPVVAALRTRFGAEFLPDSIVARG